MKRVIEGLKKKKNAKKMELGKVMRLTSLPTSKDTAVIFEMVSEEYKLSWFKKRISMLAKNLNVKATFYDERQAVTFECDDYGKAIFFAACIDKDTRDRTFDQFFRGRIKL